MTEKNSFAKYLIIGEFFLIVRKRCLVALFVPEGMSWISISWVCSLIFAYIGIEQGISIWMVKFLNEYRGWNSATNGVKVVSVFCSLTTAGRLLFILLSVA